ncbi:proline-rich receptor-like protein kinase PERK1 [Chaetomidium leptoderma]|uniref:Proline-rich receptor-like protein kinase PERK1 n=1 Tax=Chaetomidium leptoderma TaxID=669021 RepID=A0AAN6VTV2_9PEZI|nr:proline-rich receptor-like protein kinase PERK1 [Chaetomidium leptoderma]
MRLFVAALAALATLGSAPRTALAVMEFHHPPQYTGLSITELTEKPVVRVLGTPVELEWTSVEEGKKLSVVLYQLNATQAATFDGKFPSVPANFEFITHDQVEVSKFRWIVGTAKDLSESSVFALAIWAQGAQVTDSTTDMFFIAKEEPKSSSATSSATTMTTTTTTSSSSTSPSTTSSSTTTTPLPSSSSTADSATESTPPAAANDQSSGGLSTGAAVGVGIGATLAVVLLVAVGWYCGMRRARMWREAAVQGLMDEQHHHQQQQQQTDKSYYSGPPPPTELNATPQAVEAPGWNQRRHELS